MTRRMVVILEIAPDEDATARVSALLGTAVATGTINAFEARPVVDRSASGSGVTLEQALALVRGSSRYRKEFAGWLALNWAIWERFELEADRTWAFGRDHYAARTLIEYIRHETLFSEAGGEWKINGNYVPDLSRLYRAIHPARADFFEERNQVQTNRPSAGVRAAADVEPVFAPAPVVAERTSFEVPEAVPAEAAEEALVEQTGMSTEADASVEGFLSWLGIETDIGMPPEPETYEDEAALHATGHY